MHIPVAQDSCNNLRAKQADSASHSEQDKKKFNGCLLLSRERLKIVGEKEKAPAFYDVATYLGFHHILYSLHLRPLIYTSYMYKCGHNMKISIFTDDDDI